VESGGKLHRCNYYPLWCYRMSVPICSIGLPAGVHRDEER
jgi:hypothetical protein